MQRSRVVQTLNAEKNFSDVGSTGKALTFAKIHSGGERPTRGCTSSGLHSLRPCWTAFLSVLHTSDDLTLDTSHLQYLQYETLQVARFRHGGEDGMVAGLPTLFKQADLPLGISCSKADTCP